MGHLGRGQSGKNRARQDARPPHGGPTEIGAAGAAGGAK